MKLRSLPAYTLGALFCVISFVAPEQARAGNDCTCTECYKVNVPDPNGGGSSLQWVCLDLVDGGYRQCSAGDISCVGLFSCLLFTGGCESSPFPTVELDDPGAASDGFAQELATLQVPEASFENQYACPQDVRSAATSIKPEESSGVTYTF